MEAGAAVSLLASTTGLVVAVLAPSPFGAVAYVTLVAGGPVAGGAVAGYTPGASVSDGARRGAAAAAVSGGAVVGTAAAAVGLLVLATVAGDALGFPALAETAEHVLGGVAVAAAIVLFFQLWPVALVLVLVVAVVAVAALCLSAAGGVVGAALAGRE